MAQIAADPNAISYFQEPRWEQVFVYYACTRPDFWERIAKYTNPALWGADEAKLLMAALKDMLSEPGAQHPASRIVVVNHVYIQSQTGGKIRIEQAAACAEYMEELPDELPDPEVMISEAVKFLRPRLVAEAQPHIHQAADPLLDPKEADKARKKAQEKLEAAGTLGEQKIIHRQGMVLGVAALGEIARVGRLPRLPFGIPELDLIYRGGYKIGELHYWLGPGKAGKTSALCQEAAAAWGQRRFVCYASLESIAEQVYAKIISNLTGIPLYEVEDERCEGHREAGRRLQWLLDNGWLGRLAVEYFPRAATTLTDIMLWVAEQEKEAGGHCDKLLVDMDRHVKHTYNPESTSLNYENMYGEMGLIAKGPDPKRHPELMRWVTTASHTKIKVAREDIIYDAEQSAESANKGRICDSCVSINPRDRGASAVLFVACNRSGKGGDLTPQAPTGYAYGRLIDVEPPYPWFKRGPDRWRPPEQAALKGLEDDL